MSCVLYELSCANPRRSEQCFPQCEDWEPVDWSNALAGEVGEACNLTKKAKRDGVLALTAIAKELGDVVIYADHLARSLGLNLRECVIQKFNEVSERVGSHERLGK